MKIRKLKRPLYDRREVSIFLQAEIILSRLDHVPEIDWLDSPGPRSDDLADEFHDTVLWPLEGRYRLSIITGWCSVCDPPRFTMTAFARHQGGKCLPRLAVRVQKAIPGFLRDIESASCVEAVEVQMINLETDEISPPPKWLRDAVSGLPKVRISDKDFFSDRRPRNEVA